MKAIISTLGAAVLLAGCACENPATVTQIPGYDLQMNRCRIARYGYNMPPCRAITNTELAVARRCEGFKRTQEIAAFEAGFYGSTIARPSGRVSDYLPGPMQCVPAPMVPVPMGPPGPQLSPPVPLPPEPVAEEAPLGECVPGKPGYVISPYSPKAGYVDVNGMAPGSLAKDPFSGKTFRVP